MQITREDTVIELVGQQKAVGDAYADVLLVNTNNDTVQLSEFVKGITIISIVPDINTRVCELQTKYLTEEVAKHDYELITVSTNTPEELKKWAEENELDLIALSDKERKFGEAYGIVMDGLDELARSVFIVDQAGVIQYVEIVPEMTNEPNYIDLLVKANALK